MNGKRKVRTKDILVKKPLSKCRVLVTPTSFARYDRNLAKRLDKAIGQVICNTSGKPLSEKNLISIIHDFDGLIVGLDKITKGVIEAAKNLKVIARYGTGVDNVDLRAAKKQGIFVTNTPSANSVSVAEFTIGLAIVSARNIIEGHTRMTSGDRWPRLSGATLSGKTFGMIGLGNIGKEVAKRLSNFNVGMLAYDINKDFKFAKKYKVSYVDLDTLLTSSDFISLHISLSEDTKNYINKENLSKMKKGAILINTARGELIDEEALCDSLSSGKLKAALDTFKKEPLGINNKILSLPQVITTPHMGAAADDASNNMTRISIEECLAVLKGERPKHIVIEP